MVRHFCGIFFVIQLGPNRYSLHPARRVELSALNDAELKLSSGVQGSTQCGRAHLASGRTCARAEDVRCAAARRSGPHCRKIVEMQTGRAKRWPRCRPGLARKRRGRSCDHRK